MSQKRKRNKVNDTQRANNIKIVPRTEAQKHLLRSIRTQSQTFAIGSAGTGKTYLTTVEACTAFLMGKVDKIVITRPVIPAGGEQIGFLPGGLNAKMGPWLIPVMEILEECLGKAQVLEYLKSGEIEIAPFGMMRGRTFKNTFVVVDEAQNTTIQQLELLLTRMGEGSVLVVSGDLKQSDIGRNSGLRIATDMIKKYGLPVGLVTFGVEDVVRSEECKMWAEVFAKEEEGLN